jgi:hypothetical protein
MQFFWILFGSGYIKRGKAVPRWVGHVAGMGRGEACAGFYWGNLRERAHWGDPCVDGRIRLRWILKK